MTLTRMLLLRSSNAKNDTLLQECRSSGAQIHYALPFYKNAAPMEFEYKT